ncbi:hypothetical protein [Pectobacterium versatile]|uniref:hypothetical protein n=1 Tax=Pectobacterium versatile TaxID=2488639 RepID=UPI00102E7492|nr:MULTISPECIES: hypothetical protein [Pectobacterium]MBN3062094.1 hypothetical protein [Pectobacterium versatile]MCL6343093.1 hypothetical protein [Pectobacterium carotovorum subsp. carotovorum]MCL6396620.1 hypothetical protein [Pectobacterium carotovorum subsp. carotovorum]
MIIIPVITIPVNITIHQTKVEAPPPPHPACIVPTLSHKREPSLWRRGLNALKKRSQNQP